MILKFTREDQSQSDEEEISYEVGLTKWLSDIDEKMKGFTYWPPSDASIFVRKERPVDLSWSRYNVEVLRYYGE